jgi:RNA-directed DNA polymerase
MSPIRFSAIPHDKLMQAVEERVCYQAVLKLVRAIQRAGVMDDGQVRRPVAGAAQGGFISPLLCNVYLHRVDRVWSTRARCSGEVRRRRAGDVSIAGAG